MTTLAKSGAIFELYRNRDRGEDLRLAVRFHECRLRQLRRAARWQMVVIFGLWLRSWLPKSAKFR